MTLASPRQAGPSEGGALFSSVDTTEDAARYVQVPNVCGAYAPCILDELYLAQIPGYDSGFVP